MLYTIFFLGINKLTSIGEKVEEKTNIIIDDSIIKTFEYKWYSLIFIEFFAP